jgi:hypothetical protein
MKNHLYLKYWIYKILFATAILTSAKTTLAVTQLDIELKPDYLPNVAGATAEDKIYSFTGNLIITMMQIVGGVAIILIIYNGFKYTIARGEESEIEQSKTNLMWIIGGLILMTIAYVVIRFVVKLTLIVDEVN